MNARLLLLVVLNLLLATRLAIGAAPENSAASHAGRWVRRIGEVARVSENQLTEFRKLTTKLPEVMEKHGFTGQSLFVKEIAPGVHYAFRFTEYAGERLADDVAGLRSDPAYRDWQQSVDACLITPWKELEEVFYWAGRTEAKKPPGAVQYYGQIVGLRPEMADAYKLLHAHPWPGVLAKITEGNIRNYAIFWDTIDSKMYLFAYFEYVGSDFAADMAAIDGDPVTQAWIKFTDQGCQLPLSTRQPSEWWANMDELFSRHSPD